MNQAVYFKVLQRKNKFRNPKHDLSLPPDFEYSSQEMSSAIGYLYQLDQLKINYTYPGHEDYPSAFLKMQEPPLFLEYIGKPIWKTSPLISVVGSRKIHPLSQLWMKSELPSLLHETDFRIVSGGAIGVDLLSHTLSVMSRLPTIAVLPSGLSNLYPMDLQRLAPALLQSGGAIISEFEHLQVPHKSHFFYRNRLIAALGVMTLVVQSEQRSGTFLTVHHALQNGRQVAAVPAHPGLSCFKGNTVLLQDGALPAYNKADLKLYLQTESQFGQ